MYGRAVSMANGSNCCCCCLAQSLFCYCVGCCICCERAKLRTNYGIHGGGCCNDGCCCLSCYPCALCQIIQEVNYKEDVRIGCCGHPDGSAKCACDCQTGDMAKNRYSHRTVAVTVVPMVEMMTR